MELLVVNNNCTDRTDDVIRSFENRLPIRRAFEPTPGQSNARNRIVAEATGDYILWTDDDVTVSPDWLVAYAEAFRARPAGGLFGGPIVPLVDELRPDAREGRQLLLCHSVGPVPHPLFESAR